jgi:D-sedoheptulose 7-phosphate isomerase
MSKEEIKNSIQSSIHLKEAILKDELTLSKIEALVLSLSQHLTEGKRIWLCGNGGSAADALHIAAEFSGRFYLNRKALPVEALNVNEAALTAIANDFGFENLFARLLEAKANKGDVLWLLSTSGKSPNIINAAKKAIELGVQTIAFTGASQTELDALVQQMIKIPSLETPRIQECHLMLGHIICELVEKKMFNE